jgi:hypothetical protein
MAVAQTVHMAVAQTVFVTLDCADPMPQRLGATPAAFQPAPERRRILFDPAGHPFCLTTQIPREAR